MVDQEVEIMNHDIETINQMRAITISREYGSGGGELGPAAGLPPYPHKPEDFRPKAE
jgi:hypothetical protein